LKTSEKWLSSVISKSSRSMGLYKDFTTIEELNQQYLPSVNGLNARDIFARWDADSRNARSFLSAKCDIRFGPTVDEYIDVFPCGTRNAPVHIFMHGGYWHSFSPKDFSFIANRLVERGITVVLNNYSLCPFVAMDEIVRQCRAAIKWVVDHIADFDGNPENITISGHSAGGHLAAMVAITDWKKGYGVSSNFMRGICGISGLYDLQPFPFTTLQPYLQLTCEQIMRNSPILHARSNLPPTQLFVGEKESPEFHRQSEDFSRELRRRNNKAEKQTIAAANHFTILDGFLDDSSEVFKAIIEMCFTDG
jgi:arylformamidase